MIVNQCPKALGVKGFGIMILGESYALRYAKVVATLLCALGLGHMMQDDWHDPEVHELNSKLKNFVHTTFTYPEDSRDTGTYALISVVQIAGEKSEVMNTKERLSPYAQVVHTREISSDIPTAKFPSEVPSPQFDLMALSK